MVERESGQNQKGAAAGKELVSTTSSTMLMRKLLDHPELPALIPKLQTPTLTRLIATLGVEDAGPLVAHTTTRQLQRVFDETLWRSLGPGGVERMEPQAFLLWLQVLLEQGEGFVAERLQALGLQFVAAQFLYHIDTHDMQDRFAPLEVEAEQVGGYLVVAKTPEDWDLLRSALVSLDTDYPDFCQAVLANISLSVSHVGLSQVAHNAALDGQSDRDKRRMEDGFVTPASALEFLAFARTQPLAETASMQEYSTAVRPYLSRELRDHDAEQQAVDLSGLQELNEVLQDTQRIANNLRLPAAESTQLPLKQLLDQLEREQPEVFGNRLAELVFLGNVLVAGCKDAGEPFSEVEAANAVLATANLGSAYLLSQQGVSLDELLHQTPGLVRAFSVGWYILHQIPQRTARALVAILREPAIRMQLQPKSWILEEVDLALADMVNNVDLADFESARDSLAIVSLVLEPEMVARLQVLISEFPRLPLEFVPGERVRVYSRRMDSLADLQQVDEQLQKLPASFRL